MTSADLRERLARLGVTPAGFGEVLARLDPERPAASHVREAYRLASPDNDRPIPSAVRALLALMERAPEAWRDAA